MKPIKILFAISICVCMAFSYRSAVDGCSVLHNGTFIYKAEKEDVKVVIDGENHTEYHHGGKYIIQSTLVWVNECEYNTTLIKSTIPGFPYEAGDVMNVTVDKIEGMNIYYTALIKGQSWKGMLTKLK